MARGTARAPSQNAYRGSIGRTQTALVHVTGARGDLIAAQVYTSIDAVSDPDLVDRLHSDDPARALNVVRVDGADPIQRRACRSSITTPLPSCSCWCSPTRIATASSRSGSACSSGCATTTRQCPRTSKDFAVVFGASGLRAYLERRAQEALETARTADAARELDRRRADVAVREGEIERAKGELERAKGELAKRERELDTAKAEVERARVEIERLRSEARNRVIAAVAQEAADKTSISPAPTPTPRPERDEAATKPILLSTLDELERTTRAESDSDNFDMLKTGAVDVAKVANGAAAAMAVAPMLAFDDDETTGSAIIPQGSDPLTTDTKELLQDTPIDAWLEKATHQGRLERHRRHQRRPARARRGRAARTRLRWQPRPPRAAAPHSGLSADHARDRAARRAAGAQHRPSSRWYRSTSRPIRIARCSTALARKFEITVELIVRGRRIRRVRLVAPLADNVGYILRAAEDHLRGIASAGEARRRSSERATSCSAPATICSEASTRMRPSSATTSSRSSGPHSSFAARSRWRAGSPGPSREDYLVCTRGFPLPRWRELRRHVLECAVAWGLWMGPELAQVAVSEGLARSRRDLIGRLDRGFEALKRHPTAFDIDADAADDNYKAIAEEARALGVELAKATNGRAIASDEVSVVSGSIGTTPVKGTAAREVDRRAARSARGQAATRQGGDRAVRARRPARGRAGDRRGHQDEPRRGGPRPRDEREVRGCGRQAVDSGPREQQGASCAMAARSPSRCCAPRMGTQAVIDLLLNEPTEIWREVARAIGQVGPTALMPLASNVGRLGDRVTPQLDERVAWAMAHIAVRGGKAAVETMAAGQSVLAPIAKHALELHASAARDQVRVRPGAEGSQHGRDVTVNRAFSRRFFEALEQGLPEAGHAALISLDASAPMEMLDESDLIEDDDEAELDESDLIQS